MEMKKQVLSFNEFVNEAYKIINEAETFEDAKQKLAKLLNSNGDLALGSLESLLKSNSTPIGKDGKMLAFVGEQFNRLITKYDGKDRKITKITVAVDQIGNLGNNRIDVIQGKVFVSKMASSSGMSGNTAELKDGKVNLGDLLSTVNSRNVYAKAGDSLFVYDKKSKNTK